MLPGELLGLEEDGYDLAETGFELGEIEKLKTQIETAVHELKNIPAPAGEWIEGEETDASAEAPAAPDDDYPFTVYRPSLNKKRSCRFLSVRRWRSETRTRILYGPADGGYAARHDRNQTEAWTPTRRYRPGAAGGLVQIGATNEEIAAHFGVSERTIENRAKGAGFRAAMDRGIARGNLSLRRKQMQMALAGDRVMLIWLGKQRLGQQDKVEHSGNVEGGAPPNIHVNFISPAATKPAGDEGQQN